MKGHSYQMTTGDDRIWVHQDGVFVGWLDRKTGNIRPPISVKGTNAMLDAALKRPKTGEPKP